MKNYSFSPEEAAAELLKRKRARASLLDYAKAIDVPGRPVSADPDEWVFEPIETGLAAHHILMLDTMEKVILGQLPRAMFFLPPGSAKSTYGSVVAPTWAMGKFPGTKIILSSYGQDLARKNGRRARQIARSPEYKSFFKCGISQDTAAADEWALTNDSEYLACGILSGVTGNRAVGIIVDDPIKGRQEADSDTIRARTWDVYQEDLRTRLIPGGWEILIQTRWHEDDLAGRLLPKEYDGETGLIPCRDGRDWYVVCIPAQCERPDDPLGREIGEYLWPEWFTGDHFVPFKQISRTWNALFQQRPQPDQGTYFQRSWFPRFNPTELPKYLHYYGSSDYAVTEDEGDSTEMGVVGVDKDGHVWIVDWWNGYTESDKWIDAQIDLMLKWKPFCFFGESGVIMRAVNPYLRTRMRERKAYCRTEWIPSVVDKVIKARGFQGRAANRMIHVPEGEMGDRLIDLWTRFPAGRPPVEDAVDVMSLFCLALDQAHPAIVPLIQRQPLEADKHIDAVEKTNNNDYEALARAEQRIEAAYWQIQAGRDPAKGYHDVDIRRR